MIRQHIDGTGISGRHAFWRGATAALVVLCAAGMVRAAGLTYVDAQDDFTPAIQNLFPSAGGALSTVLDNSQSTAGDGKWGFVAAGSGGNVYESVQENSPELRMHADVPDGSYDVYVAYWSGGGQEQIRAGIASNPGANTVFGAAAPTMNGASGAWVVKPLDDNNPSADDNGTTATTRPGNATGGTANNWTVLADPFYEHVPNGGDGQRFLRLAPVNAAGTPIVAAGGTGLDIFVDDGPSFGPNDLTRFDGLVYVAAGTPVFLTASIDRATGDLKINNPTQQGFSVVNYTISSPTSSLNAANWNTITHNTAGVTQAGWAISAPTTPPDPPTATFAPALTEAGSAANFVSATGQLDLGNVWRKSAIQNISIALQLADGSTVRVEPTYSGTAIAVGDFNADGVMDKTDFALMMSNLHKILTGQSVAQTYSEGDFNQDAKIDRNDFIAFRTSYCAVNTCSGAGGGAWGALIAGSNVPEPSTWLLLSIAGGVLVLFRRQSRLTFQKLFQGLATMMQGRKLTAKIAAVVTLMIGCVASSAFAQFSPVTGWQRATAGNTIDGSALITNANTNSPTFGNGTTASANNYTVFGSAKDGVGNPIQVTISPGEEVTMTGSLRINKVTTNTIPARDVRLGIWNAITPGTGTQPAAGGWIGYMAVIASGNNIGYLEVRNPDDPGFWTNLFLSDAGGGSIAATAGPAPASGTPYDSLTNTGTGTGRYFRLAGSNPNNNANFQYNQDYSFTFHVSRYGTGDNEVSAVITQTSLTGDYNSDGAVNAADYTVWRDHLGQTFALPNRDPANTGVIVQADYTSWRTNFNQQKYVWNIGGGTDFAGVIPPAVSGGNPVAVTDHTTFTFNRVGLLFGGGTGADSANLGNVQFGTDTIQTLTLNVNTSNGKAAIQNSLATPLAIDYYEISSAKGDLVQASWTGIDGTATSAPDGNGWDAAGGATNNILSEGNLTSSLSLSPGASTISLGNIFNTATTVVNRDLRFFIGLAGGGVIRGNVNYGALPAGAGAAVPEPGSLVLLGIGGLAMAAVRRRTRRS